MFYVVGSRLADSLLITDHDGIFAVGNDILPLHDFDMTGKQAFVLKFNAFNFPIVTHNEILDFADLFAILNIKNS
ncbi:hypothetical protein D3C75_1128160 [compost metagenome]